MITNVPDFLTRAVTLIALGVEEKRLLQEKSPEAYPVSLILRRGMSMFLAASLHVGHASPDLFHLASETAFFDSFLTRPVSSWFDCWDHDILEALRVKDLPFYDCGPLAERISLRNAVYVPSEDCASFLDSRNLTITSSIPRNAAEEIDEFLVYEKLRALEQEDYVAVRRFLIGHPILEKQDWLQLHLQYAGRDEVLSCFSSAYERIPGSAHVCPVCGWTLQRGDHGLFCQSRSCVEPAPDISSLRPLLPGQDLRRLRLGVMRFIAWPGRLELDIADICAENSLSYDLWPDLDRYDIRIRFSDGAFWAIDAKAYRNPSHLRSYIEDRGRFPCEAFEKAFFAVPDLALKGQRNYTTLVNRALADQENVTCVSLGTLKAQIQIRMKEVHHI